MNLETLNVDTTPRHRFFPIILMVTAAHIAVLAAAAIYAPPEEERDQVVRVEVVQLRGDTDPSGEANSWTSQGKATALLSYKKLRANGLME